MIWQAIKERAAADRWPVDKPGPPPQRQPAPPARAIIKKETKPAAGTDPAPGNLLKNCCPAPAAFRAGLSVSEAGRLYKIPCDKMAASDCCECWQLLEKVEIYNAQAAQAKAGNSSLLKHLGRAVLLQDGKTRVIDPGLGDLIFEVETPEEPAPAEVVENGDQDQAKPEAEPGVN